MLTEITIQSSAVAVKWSLEVCNWISCCGEKVYDLINSKRDFINLRKWRLCQWWITSLNLSLHKFFFNYLFLRNLSDTSINTNITYANLIGANPLQKRICRSITSAIWKQKETLWTQQIPILNWMDVHSSPIVKFLTWQRWIIYISKRVFPTAVYSG